MILRKGSKGSSSFERPIDETVASIARLARARRKEVEMKDLTYEQHLAGLLVIDPYNDFISQGGKVWPLVQEVAEATSCVSNMKAVLEGARRANLRIFFALHHRYRARDYETWKYIAPIQREAWEHKIFEDGTWGGEIHPDFLPQPGEIIAQEHWCSKSSLASIETGK